MNLSSVSSYRVFILGFGLSVFLTAQAAPQIDYNATPQLADSHEAALNLQRQVNKVSQARTSLLSSFYYNVSQAYTPGTASQWVLPLMVNPDSTLPFLIGDKNRILASLSFENGGRGVAYGADIFEQLNKKNTAHAPLFKRVVQWLISGDPQGTVPNNFRVSIVGVNVTTVLNSIKSAGLNPVDAKCNALTDSSCASATQLLALGNNFSDSDKLTEKVRASMRAGMPVIFVHSNSWTKNVISEQILNGLGLQLGPYGGNYWENDSVPANRTPEYSMELVVEKNLHRKLVDQIADGSWRTDYDWSKCTEYVGSVTCDKVPELSSFIQEVDTIKKIIDSYDQKGLNVFAIPDTTTLRMWLLWADAVRQTIYYPMDKVADPARFQEAFVADSIVGYVNTSRAAQRDLGSYAGERHLSMPVSESEEETITLTLPAIKGSTAIGRMAVPGKRVTISVHNSAGATIAVGFNTQHKGSTRLWNPQQYDRPRFLKSPDIALTPGQQVTLVSPYGGLLQLIYSGATPKQTVTVKVIGAAKHPFLDIGEDTANSLTITNFMSALEDNTADWLEMRINNVEVHAQADKISSIIRNIYGGDVERYIRELDNLFIGDAYTLAGFDVPGQPLHQAIYKECQARSWDCEDKTLHKNPDTQHINVDAYAQCGAGCSGNPYDQNWGLNPRGWGESHELGHNLQVNRLKVYGVRSSEVSNQIFPLHKGWRLFREYGHKQDFNSWASYRNAYNLIAAGHNAVDPIEGVYKRIWEASGTYSQNGERMTFYTQWVHYWADLKSDPMRGWDIWTLLYLHQRQVNASDWATYKDRLGYSTYAVRPGSSGDANSTDGNDNLLIALSWLTQRDQRPTFDLWGIRISAAAKEQVVAYGFAIQPAFFYAIDRTNDYNKVQRLDMSNGTPAWPFP
ncbi:ImpA family metalloprotease [Serratia sp. UGAL515B_01]|uniref:ImpA family metalloprotease n=1 Tax=Serratia sp. UGAL515B_01 TaxID=2986763 RepID=UPI0029545DC3|nr:ImpA family metalloprotease [Serratia sp. UGAL515B_01]WON77721.1 ImpA family metalloprotease [Serratia sp. UGAL515B_01]